MATTTITSTRRAILGALAVAPVAIAAPVCAIPNIAWEQAKAEYRTTYAAWEAANDAYHVAESAYFDCLPERRKPTAEYRAADAAARQLHNMDAIEAAEREARDRWLDALKRLIQTPASDLDALAEKVAIVAADYGDENEWIADLLRDVTTLGGRA